MAFSLAALPQLDLDGTAGCVLVKTHALTAGRSLKEAGKEEKGVKKDFQDDRLETRKQDGARKEKKKKKKWREIRLRAISDR